MITITSEYLDANWQILESGNVLPTQFSEWDAGDAYTLSTIGILPSKKVAFGAIVLEETKVSDFSLVVRLRKKAESVRAASYRCPDGTTYEVTAERMVDGANTPIPVSVESVVKQALEDLF